jgi:hypothetical protein
MSVRRAVHWFAKMSLLCAGRCGGVKSATLTLVELGKNEMHPMGEYGEYVRL